MSKLQVLEIPHPILRETAAHVEVVTPEIQELLSDMLETMYATNGVGLAGNQVGKLLRVVVVDCGDEKPDPIKMVNPEIISHSENKILHSEGCLSVPREYADVERFETVTVRYLDENGKEQTRTTDGLLAIAFQHEIDHLDGHLFIDYLSQLKRHRLLKHLEKRRKKEAQEAEE
ncbi:MAG: peptide deformylase [Alphaproteobacteria bacterium]|nr:peptide deformylase [Alphaproteobacteria bacterium]